MFDWLFSLFQKKDKFDLYTVKERKIFTYFDGKDHVKADPLVLFRRWADNKAEIIADAAVAESQFDLKDAPKAQESMIGKIRKIFDIKPFKEGGLLDAECYNLMISFLNYCEIVKKNSSKSVIISPSSEGLNPTLDINPPIPKTSVSGLTEKDQNIEKPQSLPSEQKLPTDQLTPECNIGEQIPMEKEKQ